MLHVFNRIVSRFALRIRSSLLIQNIGALSIIQASGLILPLITLPYLTRVLGPEEWGKVVWTQLLIGYLKTFIDWGFIWTGARKIATLRHNAEARSAAFLEIWIGQWILTFIVMSFIMVYIISFHDYGSYKAYIASGLGVILVSVLFPVWYFTGLERLKEVAVLQFLANLISVPLIFLLIRNAGHGPIVLAIGSAVSLLAGFAAIYRLVSDGSIRWRVPSFENVFFELRAAGTMFLSRASTLLYTTFVPILLGAIAGPVAVAHFMLANKARLALQGLLAPASQALFPRMSYLFSEDRRAAVRLLLSSGSIILGISFAASLLLWVFAGPIVRIMGGESFGNADNILRWLAPVICLVAISNIAGMQIMLPNQMNRAFNAIIICGGILSLGLSPLLIHKFSAMGAAAGTFLIELLIALAMVFYVLTRWWFLDEN